MYKKSSSRQLLKSSVHPSVTCSQSYGQKLPKILQASSFINMFMSIPLVACVGIFATLGQALPSPAAVVEVKPIVILDAQGNVESFANATALGVDIYGPMPDDAKFVDGHWEGEPGTKAHAWFRAQIDIDWDSVPEKEKEKRQGSSQMEVTMFTGDNCSGGFISWGIIDYGESYLTWDNMFSLGIGRRGIRGNEHLDLSTFAGDDICGRFVIRAVGGPGCANTPRYNCLRFWSE
ncbi:hypothetical protein B0I35DRAFT_480950 [Stachybotrys elegans]|uniref:Uncharacterized protein n=1 Tax=Stachybotrys elegans TaxID=80388 RepID=A0A8K0WQC9_9HYPO|nr:hypothetical protein B0I35DRAFT_480950 [Stachybotrys elegans]